MKSGIVLLGTLIVLVSASILLAQPENDPQSPVPPNRIIKTSPWFDEVQAILAVRNDTRKVLEQEFKAAADEVEALAIQRRILELEKSTELQIMNTQLSYLKKSGRTAESELLEASIREMSDPQPRRVPESRDDLDRR